MPVSEYRDSHRLPSLFVLPIGSVLFQKLLKLIGIDKIIPSNPYGWQPFRAYPNTHRFF
jgi:hypothetical protein